MITSKTYYVYILASKPYGTLYVGMTGDLTKRIFEHREKNIEGFTERYAVTLLVYYEVYVDVYNAIQREKAIKKWNRDWKLDLIAKHNPEWKDLFCENEILPLPRESNMDSR
jgi:putative endonuclease